MAGETGGPEDRYLMFKAVERELKEMKNSIKVQRAMHDMTQQVRSVGRPRHEGCGGVRTARGGGLHARRGGLRHPHTGCRTVIGKTFGLLWDGRERDMPHLKVRHVPSCVDCRRIAGVGGFGLLYM